MKVNPRSLANLRPFKPGADERRNLGGRPKRIPITDVYIELLDQPWEGDDSVTWAQTIALAMARAAVDGNVGAANEIADRVQGRAAVQIGVRSVYPFSIDSFDHMSDAELRELISTCDEVLFPKDKLQ